MAVGIVAVDDLRRAYNAAVSGAFRPHPRPTPSEPSLGQPTWVPAAGEQLVLVAGCGGTGASTVAVGLAEAAGDARVVECCTVASSGLAAASQAELGTTGVGWVQGTRGGVLLERRSDRIANPSDLPAPTVSDRRVTVLDSSWDLDVVLASPGWLGEMARTLPQVVVVARPTVPSVRRLEAAIGLVGVDRATAVLVGADRRIPKLVEQAWGGLTRQLRRDGRLVLLPFDAGLAVAGLSPDRLPARFSAGCVSLFTSLKGTLR